MRRGALLLVDANTHWQAHITLIGYAHPAILIMAELSAASSSEKPSDTFRHLSMRVSRGMAIPSQMLSPGEDGYRTPTIEDYEQDCRQKDHQSGHYGGLAHQPARMYNLHASSSATRSHFSLSKGLENLAWKQRLRHFTWSFFTMTMATGGIANVLHTGLYVIFLKRSPY